jgi:putative tricarboxylic transport membrane protein
MQKKADPYTIFATTTPVYSTMVKRHVSLDEFTPLCRMAIDPIVFTVSGASPYKDATEVIAAARKARKSIKMGIGSIGGTDNQVGEMIARATGVEFNIISFKNGGEAMTAVLGGHVDFSCSNYAEAIGQIEAGKLRMLATAGDKRLPYLPNLPTLKERGIDVSFSQARGFFLTKGVAPEVVKYFEAAIDKLRKTESWKKYLQEDYLLDAPLSGSEFKAWLANEFIVYEKNLKAMGQFDK